MVKSVHFLFLIGFRLHHHQCNSCNWVKLADSIASNKETNTILAKFLHSETIMRINSLRLRKNVLVNFLSKLIKNRRLLNICLVINFPCQSSYNVFLLCCYETKSNIKWIYKSIKALAQMHASMVLTVIQALKLNACLWLDDGVSPPTPTKIMNNSCICPSVLVRKRERKSS